ncbi:SDR family oxidoreductase [Aetokthonos hydrillicola Thurmond2011]|jgi:3-oxoacyl-[acyl-carrier protein] reductase|uniref:SDR family oxidoreductase n=1 Tax=Aetokthonos hydrillicola Thurmond2011 TaxID=2712845 RepID=A0AAP5M6J2_9CYAN|nr:SDR family oxidoreductase [Aetokthonos hydrillicola]MBO3458626.1 SDR family oxidoreductase [Aetokthonos hydrillicola CCALA 1050]MBW4587979.1 SDR family oxidoreductase [Aetokthonos hydrillicola CCALA 1050]MDR9897066.1 SDR family oxidoreductase [Aetokthonos hydrillicola Thurmond2011]
MVTTQTQLNQNSNVHQLMSDRVVLITGASRGIGAATAKLLAHHGATVGINYYSSEAEAQALVDEISSHGGKALALKADVRSPEQVNAIVEQFSEAFGAIDTLVINANASFPVAPFIDYRWEDFEAKLLGELKGAFFPCKAVVPSMIEHERGCIIAVSSGLSRYPDKGFCAHSTAKSGLDAFVKSLALELGAYGIRVNAVSPGLTLTDATSFLPQENKDAAAQSTPLKRNGLPEDIAGAILLLASEQAKFITGAYLPVSGGIQML